MLAFDMLCKLCDAMKLKYDVVIVV